MSENGRTGIGKQDSGRSEKGKHPVIPEKNNKDIEQGNREIGLYGI